MNYYILPLIVNDRREVIVQLSENQSQSSSCYIVEVPDNVQFNLFSMLKDADIKSFIPDTQDIDISNITPEYLLQDNTLKVLLKIKESYVPPTIAQETAEPEQAPLTYDDLDAYTPTAKPKTPQMFEAPKVQSESYDIGTYADTIRFMANNFSNGALSVLGSAGAQIDNVKQTTFPNLKVHIELLVNDKKYSNTFTIAFAHPEQFIGLALDFGSESSQLSVKRYQSGFGYQEKKPEAENLYRNIYAFHKSQGWIPKEDNSKYYQEEDNTNYYKSIFFLKEDLSGDYEDIEKELFIQELPENLKMLVNSSSHDNGFVTLTEKKFHQLPNLKITHKYVDVFTGLNFNINKDGYDINVSLSEVKNKTYNSILKVIIASFLKKEFIKYSTAQRKIRFILLVPNIYDYADVRHTQLLLNNIFKDFSEHDYKDRILAWEVMTISESDASFLGYINKNDVSISKNSDYIIVDAGKGTTDFSVIKTGTDNVFNIKPMYRNGFAGAGNMITFAVFETVLHYIRAHSANQNLAFRFVKDQILRNLTDSNLEVKNRFYKELERLKFNFNDNVSYVLNQWASAQSGDFTFKNITEPGANIETLIDLLSQIENISDFYGYIGDTCNLLSQRVVSNLKMIKDNKEDFRCAGIVLTGRGFMFKPLEREMRNCMQSQLGLPNAIIHTLDGNELKDVCIKGVFNNTVRLNTERIGYPIQVVTKEPEIPQEAKKEPAPAKKVGFTNRLLNIFFNELNDIENAKTIITNEEPIAYNSLYKSQILIGAKRFKVSSGSMYDNQNAGMDADIIFTPQGFLVRRKEDNIVKNILPLTEIFDHDRVEMNMVIPSLFPNYIDEQYIFSLRRDDIKKSPIMPPAPPPSSSNADITKPKGPIYF